MTFGVTMFEDGHLIQVRVKATGATAAQRKAEALCPDAAYLTTKRILVFGSRTMTQEDRDRLSILLRDAHHALEEAWQLCVYAGDRTSTNTLVLADVGVFQVGEALEIYSVES